MSSTHRLILLALFLVLSSSPAREPKLRPRPKTKIVRARALGIPFEGTPGKFNAITDVAGVEVGYSTIIQGRRASSKPARVRCAPASLPSFRAGTIH